MVVPALSGEAGHLDVAGGKVLEEAADLVLAHGVGQVVVALVDVFLRHIGIEVVERLHTHRVQHLSDIIRSVGNVRVHYEKIL